MSDARTDAAPLTPVVFHVLLALSEGPLHGYAIMKEVERESGQSMGPGTIYGALQRLQEAGWIDEAATDPTDARRGRAFRLTAEGQGSLRAEAERITRLARHEAVRRFAGEAKAT